MGQLWGADPGSEGFFRVKVNSMGKRREATGVLFLDFSTAWDLGSGILMPQAVTHCITCLTGQERASTGLGWVLCSNPSTPL